MTNKIKSLTELSWKVTEEEYRADKALSYSTIAKFHREGFNGLNTLFDKVESPSLLFGSLVDTMLTGTDEEFNDRYVVAEFPSIPDSQITMVKYLFNRYSEEYSELSAIPDSFIITASEVLEFQKNWKPETRAKVIKENGGEYYNLLHLCIGKTLISSKDSQDAQECVRVLNTHPHTSGLFEPVGPFEDNIEKLYQLKFKAEYKGISLRCMADLIIVDHEKKKVYPCDLKTSFKKEWEFHHSFMQWCYWIQAQLYWYIIREVMDKDEIYKDYTLEDYTFIVISNNSRIPLVWKYTDTQAILDCYYGKNKQYYCKNWRFIVPELHYYLENKPQMPKNIKNTNNIIDWLNNE